MYSVEDLIAFLKIVEGGSVTGAAQSMELDPATVSRRLSKLEAKLDVSLIKRSTRRMSITTEGRLFYKHARCALEILNKAESRLKSSAEGCSPPELSLAAPSWISQRFLVPILERLRSVYAGRFELLAANDPNSAASAIMGLSVGLPDADVHHIRLMRNQTILCASSDYLNRMGGVSSPGDLVNRACISATDAKDWLFKSLPNGLGPRDNRDDLCCSDEHVLIDAAKSGLGVASLSSVLAVPAIQSGQLVEVLGGEMIKEDKDIYLHCDVEFFNFPDVENCFNMIKQCLISL